MKRILGNVALMAAALIASLLSARQGATHAGIVRMSRVAMQHIRGGGLCNNTESCATNCSKSTVTISGQTYSNVNMRVNDVTPYKRCGGGIGFCDNNKIQSCSLYTFTNGFCTGAPNLFISAYASSICSFVLC